MTIVKELEVRDILRDLKLDIKIFNKYEKSVLWNDWIPSKKQLELNANYILKNQENT